MCMWKNTIHVQCVHTVCVHACSTNTCACACTLYMMPSCAHVHTAFYHYMELYEAIHVHVCKLDISLFSPSPSALPIGAYGGLGRSAQGMMSPMSGYGTSRETTPHS